MLTAPDGGKPVFAIALSAFFALALFIWWHADNSYPFWDAASHVKDSIKYAELFRHPHLVKLHWWKEFLTVNYDYPLTLHAYFGFFKAIFGYGRLSDCLAFLTLQFVFNLSIYRLTILTTRDKLAAALAILIVNCYPMVNMLSHIQLLDYGAIVLGTLGLLGIVSWSEERRFKNALIMGLTVALASTAKQMSAIYMIVPCLILFFQCLLKKQTKQLSQLILAGSIVAFSLLAWLLPNLESLREWVNYYKGDRMHSGSYLSSCLENFSGYVGGLPTMMSPLLTLLFVLAAAYVFRNRNRYGETLWIPVTANVGGLLLMSFLSINKPELRYIVPVLTVPAIVTALLFADIWRSKAKMLAPILLATILIQFVIYNFAPYPLPLPEGVARTVREIAGHSVKQEAVEPRPNPTARGDLYGQNWAIGEVGKAQRGVKTYLNIQPSTPDLSVHTLDLVALFSDCKIECSTFRMFTLRGDKIRYDENAIKFYPWYLLKTGHQGGDFYDSESARNYQAIENFIKSGKDFKLYASHKIADGSELSLYHRKY